jgi:hypothetical protein
MEPLDFEGSLDMPLDPAIADAVRILHGGGIETFESCQGGDGHTYPEPTVRFHGERADGYRALGIAVQGGLRVAYLRRIWSMNDGEPTGPWWELVFVPPTTNPQG